MRAVFRPYLFFNNNVFKKFIKFSKIIRVYLCYISVCNLDKCTKLCAELGSFGAKCGSVSHTSYSCDCTNKDGEVDLIRLVNDEWQ